VGSALAVEVRRPFLNSFCLWDAAFLEKEVAQQKKNKLFFEVAAKVSFLTYLFFSAFMTFFLGAASSCYLPPVVYSIIYLYHPFMELTYHHFKAKVSFLGYRTHLFEGLLEKYQEVLALNTEEIQAQVEKLVDTSLFEPPPIYLPLLVQNKYFEQEKSQLEESLKDQKSAIEQEEQELVLLSKEEKKRKEQVLIAKRAYYYKQEERLCIRKIELAFIRHLMAHPFDKKRLAEFGNYHEEPFADYCARSFFKPAAPSLFFETHSGKEFTKDEIRSNCIETLHEHIFKQN